MLLCFGSARRGSTSGSLAVFVALAKSTLLCFTVVINSMFGSSQNDAEIEFRKPLCEQ